MKELSAGLPSGYCIKREEELNLELVLSSGRKVTGRPDMVVCLADGTPIRGIELKSVCSLWTAIDAKVKGKPKVAHLIQAGHYSKMMNIPFEIWYTNRVEFSIPEAARWCRGSRV
jgi:hypothetical protein